jgi:hypothetical protein
MTATTTAARRAGAAPKIIKSNEQDDNHVARFRPNELLRVCEERYDNGIITPDDDGLTLSSATLDAFVLSADPDQRMTNFLIVHCPWMSPKDRERAKQAAIKARRFWSPLALGDALKLTWQERQKLKITTFRPAGVSDAELVAMRRKRDAASKREKRKHERLHPEPKPSKPARRLAAILEIVPQSAGWVSVKVVCAEVKRRKIIPFASVVDLTSAIHDAINLGLTRGALEKRFVPGPRPAISVAQIRRRSA